MTERDDHKEVVDRVVERYGIPRWKVEFAAADINRKRTPAGRPATASTIKEGTKTSSQTVKH